jgi:hypothetical protein
MEQGQNLKFYSIVHVLIHLQHNWYPNYVFQVGLVGILLWGLTLSHCLKQIHQYCMILKHSIHNLMHIWWSQSRGVVYTKKTKPISRILSCINLCYKTLAISMQRQLKWKKLQSTNYIGLYEMIWMTSCSQCQKWMR